MSNKKTKKIKQIKKVEPVLALSEKETKKMFVFLNKPQVIKAMQIIKIVFFVLIMSVAIIMMLVILPVDTPIKPFIVTSGSMRPTIYEGSVTFVNREIKSYAVGDIIAFIRPDDFTQNVTHRIAGVETVDGKEFYKTKGDANNGEDQWLVSSEAIWGRVNLTIPLIGHLVNFAKTKHGVILVVVIPLLLIAIGEMRTIHGEVKKIRKSRADKRSNAAKALAVLLMIALPIFGSNISTTLAAWTDDVQITGSRVDTGFWVPPAVTVVSPNGGQTLFQNNNYLIRWNAVASTGTITMINLYYSDNGGASFTSILPFDGVNDGIFNWTVPSNIFSSNLVVRVEAIDSNLLSGSDDSNTAIIVDSPIVLNEFLPDAFSDDALPKPNGEWVELRNNGSVPVDVNGWVLYDEDDTSDLIVSAINSDSNGDPSDAGETIVPAGGYLVVYRNADANFELDNSSPDSLRLYNAAISPSGILIDSYSYTANKGENLSYARIPDGFGSFVDPYPTPGEPNTLDGPAVPEPEILMSIDTPLVLQSVVPSPNPEPSATSEVSSEPTLTPVPTADPLMTPFPIESTEPVVPTPSEIPIEASVSAETIMPTGTPEPSELPTPTPEVTLPESVDIILPTEQESLNV